jgi:diguanylate cyclase (GGDEF)-like protein
MLQKSIKQFGIYKTTVGFTIISILISILMTAVLSTLLKGIIEFSILIIATVVPAIITPFVAYTLLRLVYHLNLAEERLRSLSMTDELTQAYNRRYFIETADKLVTSAKRYGDSFAIIIFDIDDFKRVNDAYGHAAGDKVLQVLSETCKTQIRDSDTFARYGGEEFVILVPRCSPTDIVKFAERIRIKLSETRVRYGQIDIQFTISMGAGIFNSTTPNLDAILMRADAALYAAKKKGKNCTVLM